MVKTTFTRTFACLVLLTLAASTLLAQDSRARYPQAATRDSSSSVIHPMAKPPSSCKKIFSNLGSSTDAYDANNGYYVSGINNVVTAQKQDIALPFTPKANSTVVTAKLALQYAGSGYNGATVAIYSDNGGLPGSALANATRDPKNFGAFGSGCCKLAVVWFPAGVKLTGGTQYWLVATTDKKSMDSLNVWDFVWNDAVVPFAFQQDDGGWLLDTTTPSIAAAVYGSIP
jgi:hypothetical protein